MLDANQMFNLVDGCIRDGTDVLCALDGCERVMLASRACGSVDRRHTGGWC